MSEPRPVKLQLVDDDSIALNVLELALSQRGFEITTCDGGEECLEQLNADDIPDLILLDVKMPEPDGIQTLAIIRETWDLHQLPVILLTAMEESELAVMGFKGGANDYINKPVDVEELLSRITLNLQHR